MKERIISALVGLAGAYANNGKTENTDEIVREALLGCFLDVDETVIVEKIKAEKFAISPGCATCQMPCGNTSDYDMEGYLSNEKTKPVKEELLREAGMLAERLKNAGVLELPEVIYRAISYFGYDLEEESYVDLINKMKEKEI